MKWRFLIVAAYLLPTISLRAAEGTPAASGKEVDFLEILAAGGVMMYPLAVLSVITVVLIFLYALTIRRNAVVSDRFMIAAEAMVRKRDFLGLIAYCHRQNQCMARITQKALDFFTKTNGASFSEVREVAEAEGSRQAGMLNQRITYLADIGSIAPMLGLLGTVIGMIKSFFEISTGGFEGVRQMQLASGVSEALITTATGLVIGITALVFYSLFRGRVRKFVSELEAASTHMMALLHAEMHRASAARTAAPARNAAPYLARQDDEVAPLPTTSPLDEVDRPDLQGI